MKEQGRGRAKKRVGREVGVDLKGMSSLEVRGDAGKVAGP